MSLLRRGVIKSYNGATHEAAVQISGSLGVWLDALPVATDIAAADVVAGRECAVLLFSDDNPADGVIVTVHGAPPGAPGGGGSAIKDTDQDTRVETEAGPDEDKVRLTVLGTLRYLAQSATPHHQFTGDVQIGAGSGRSYHGVNIAPDNQDPGGTVLYVRIPSGAPTGSGYWYGVNIATAGGFPSAGSGHTVVALAGLPTVNITGAVSEVSALNFYGAVTGGNGQTLGQYNGVVVWSAYANSFLGTVLQAAGIRVNSPALVNSNTSVWQLVAGVDVYNVGHARVQNAYGVRVRQMSLATVAVQPFREEGSTPGDAHGNRFPSNTQFASLTGSFGGGAGVIGIANAATEPGSAPSGGGVLYAAAGQLRWLDSAGRVAHLSPETITRALANGDNHNLDPGNATMLRITGPTAAFAVTGITGGQTGRMVFLYNTTAWPMTIRHENAGSLASARIKTMTNLDVSSASDAVALLVYSGTDARWVLVSLNG